MPNPFVPAVIDLPSKPDTINIPLCSFLTTCQSSCRRCLIYYNSYGNTSMSQLSGSVYLGRSPQWFRSQLDTGTDPREPPIHPQLCSRCVGWPDWWNSPHRRLPHPWGHLLQSPGRLPGSALWMGMSCSTLWQTAVPHRHPCPEKPGRSPF